MTWQRLFENPRKEKTTVVLLELKGRPQPVECEVIGEALTFTNDPRWPTGMKPSGRYWLRRLDTGQRLLFPRSLP